MPKYITNLPGHKVLQNVRLMRMLFLGARLFVKVGSKKAHHSAGKRITERLEVRLRGPSAPATWGVNILEFGEE